MIKTATIVTIATMVINRDDCDVIRLIMPIDYLIMMTRMQTTMRVGRLDAYELPSYHDDGEDDDN